MRLFFRWGGVLCVVVGVVSRLNARSILPRSVYGWPGDFATSKWGVRVDGFGDLMVVLTLLGGIAFLISFTNLLDDRAGKPGREGDGFKPDRGSAPQTGSG